MTGGLRVDNAKTFFRQNFWMLLEIVVAISYNYGIG